jgi:hypothetical protein
VNYCLESLIDVWLINSTFIMLKGRVPSLAEKDSLPGLFRCYELCGVSVSVSVGGSAFGGMSQIEHGDELQDD